MAMRSLDEVKDCSGDADECQAELSEIEATYFPK